MRIDAALATIRDVLERVTRARVGLAAIEEEMNGAAHQAVSVAHGGYGTADEIAEAADMVTSLVLAALDACGNVELTCQRVARAILS